MTAAEKTLRRLLGVIALDQTYIEFALPIVTFIFLDPSSRLFPAETPMTVRSMWFGTCISIPFFINLFFAPLLSTLSDEFGRRKFLLIEIASASCFMLLAGLGVMFGYLGLVIAGFVIRGAFSRTNTTALAIVGDAASRGKKIIYMSYMQVAISIGACIGPMIAGYFATRFYFETFNYSLPFFIGAGLALINTMLTYFLIDETLKTKSSAAYQHQTISRFKANMLAVRQVLAHPDVLKTSLLLLLFQISWSTYYQFTAPLLKTVYQFSAHTLGLYIGMIAFWLIMGAGPIFKLLHNRLNNRQLLNMSAYLVLIGIGIILAVYYHFLPQSWLWASPIPIAIGDVLAYICITTLYSNMVANHMQGKVMGINFLIVGLTWGGSGFIGGVLIGYSPILPLLIAPIGVITALFIMNARFGKKMVLSYAS